MAQPSKRLRDEHAELWPRVEALKELGHDIGVAPVDELRDGLEEAYLFLENHLVPHARAEEEVLYPEVGRLLHSPKATESMSRDHVEVMDLARELGVLRVELVGDEEPSKEVEQEMRRVLYGLYALLKVHFAKEEENYLPLIDAHLSEAQANALFDRMEGVAHDAKQHVS